MRKHKAPLLALLQFNALSLSDQFQSTGAAQTQSASSTAWRVAHTCTLRLATFHFHHIGDWQPATFPLFCFYQFLHLHLQLTNSSISTRPLSYKRKNWICALFAFHLCAAPFVFVGISLACQWFSSFLWFMTSKNILNRIMYGISEEYTCKPKRLLSWRRRTFCHFLKISEVLLEAAS